LPRTTSVILHGGVIHCAGRGWLGRNVVVGHTTKSQNLSATNFFPPKILIVNEIVPRGTLRRQPNRKAGCQRPERRTGKAVVSFDFRPPISSTRSDKRTSSSSAACGRLSGRLNVFREQGAGIMKCPRAFFQRAQGLKRQIARFGCKSEMRRRPGLRPIQNEPISSPRFHASANSIVDAWNPNRHCGESALPPLRERVVVPFRKFARGRDDDNPAASAETTADDRQRDKIFIATVCDEMLDSRRAI